MGKLQLFENVKTVEVTQANNTSLERNLSEINILFKYLKKWRFFNFMNIFCESGQIKTIF